MPKRVYNLGLPEPLLYRHRPPSSIDRRVWRGVSRRNGKGFHLVPQLGSGGAGSPKLDEERRESVDALELLRRMCLLDRESSYPRRQRMLPMPWLDWSDEAFALARARDVPVLLLVTASWCRFSRELERDVLARPEVAALLAARFVCVRVDKDKRPDLDARYSRGGWPTLAWLDEHGAPLAFDTFLDAPELGVRVEEISGAWARDRAALRAQARTSVHAQGSDARPRPAVLGPEIVEHVSRTIKSTADPIHGGWGSEHKFPQTEAIDFALVRWSQTGDQEMLDLVLRTLRHMEDGEIHDQVEGGFYRYATQPDWSVPHHEKMLDSNAQRLFAYLEAWQVLGVETFRGTALGILRFLDETLFDAELGAFRGSQDADPGYAHLATLAARRERPAPACDPTIFANWNALAASALFKAAAVLDEPRRRDQALRTLDFVIDEMFDPTRGVYHYWSDGYHLPGMLSDQAYVLRALVDAVQHAGENRYLAPARALADVTIERLQSPGGGFYDTIHDPGVRSVPRQRDRSILENAVMAEALLRLSHLVRDPDYADTAREALASFVGVYRRYGYYVAGYARAVDLLFHPPIHVVVVGARATPLASSLRKAALAPYVASRIVQTIDPAEDAALLERFGLPRPTTLGAVRAYMFRGRESYAETSDPTRVAALMTRVEKS